MSLPLAPSQAVPSFSHCKACGGMKLWHSGVTMEPFCPKCDRRWHCGQPLLLGTEDRCPKCGKSVKL